MANVYITPEAIKWSLGHLSRLPKDQLALVFFLILAKAPQVQRGGINSPSNFESEFYRYLGGAIPGNGWAVYNPFEQDWRAGEYINSTIYGRLLNGSHKWTSEGIGFFKRSPAAGWPAVFELTTKGFDNLRERLSPPCLKAPMRLPLTVLAIYYYRFENLSSFAPSTVSDLVKKYRADVVSKEQRLGELFVEGPQFLSGQLLRSEPLSEEEKISCYPPSPFSAEPKKRALLYGGDIDAINARLIEGQDIADFVRNILRDKGIWN